MHCAGSVQPKRYIQEFIQNEIQKLDLDAVPEQTISEEKYMAKKKGICYGQ